MNGGVLFDTKPPTPHPTAPGLKQSHITDHWAITMNHSRRAADKERSRRTAAPSPTFSHPSDAGQPSPFGTPSSISLAGPSPTFAAAPYPAYPGHQAPYAAPQNYYLLPPGDYLPASGPSQPRRHSAHAEHDGHPPLYTTSILYDAPASAAAPYYDTPAALAKRKHESPAAGDLMATPKAQQAALPDGGKATKRVKIDDALPSVQSQLPTPPSTGRNVSSASVASHAPSDEVHGVFVTVTEDEGRKLGLVQNSTGDEAVEEVKRCGPPRVSTATTLGVDEQGNATLINADVLASELAWLERGTDSPSGPTRTPMTARAPRTPTSNSVPLPDDTPRTRETRTLRLLRAFESAPASPAAKQMHSIRVELDGVMSRVALSRNRALAFIGLDDETRAVEEVRNEDDDEWADSSAGGGFSKARPDWPDDDGPWRSVSAHKVKEQRERRQRADVLRRYLNASSDDEDLAHSEAASRRRARGVIHARTRGGSSTAGWEIYPSDARDALLFSRRRTMTPLAVSAGVIIGCACKNPSAGAGALISCTGCQTMHHVGCVGIDDIQADWMCDACVGRAHRDTLATPAARTPRGIRGSHERSAYKGSNATLALAPSPMFAGDPLRGTLAAIAHTPVALGRGPMSPSRPQRARVLSYGGDIWGLPEDSPSTPAPAAPRHLPDRFATPRVDDPVFDVNSTPSRHLDTDPRLAGTFNTLFSMTPLMSRSRNPSNLLAGETPGPAGRARNVSGVPPLAELTGGGKHEFLQNLAAGVGLGMGSPIGIGVGAAAGSPASPVVPARRLLGAHPVSPSPFTRRIGSNKFSHLRSSSRSGLGLGSALGEEDEDEAAAERDLGNQSD
ncbi:hypothetical protein Q5752_006525 [Cryptotrichosporon argae]